MRRAVLAALVAVMPFGAVAQEEDEAAGAQRRQRESNFREGARRAFPVTPEQMNELFEMYEKTSRARARVDDPRSYVAPQRREINVSFSRGGVDNIVHTATNYPTAVSFFDNTGSPWPISVKSSSNPVGDGPALFGGFEVKIVIDGGNTLEITPREAHARGAVQVYLKDAPVPITLMLHQGLPTFDSNMRVQVSSRGPNAPAHVVVQANTIETGAGFMTDMLSGITPLGAKPMKVSGASPDAVRGWRMGDRLYVRTQARPIAPQPKSYQMAEGGWQVFSVDMMRRGGTSIILTDGTQNFPVHFTE